MTTKIGRNRFEVDESGNQYINELKVKSVKDMGNGKVLLTTTTGSEFLDKFFKEKWNSVNTPIILGLTVIMFSPIIYFFVKTYFHLI